MMTLPSAVMINDDLETTWVEDAKAYEMELGVYFKNTNETDTQALNPTHQTKPGVIKRHQLLTFTTVSQRRDK
jgi:hypothetical protein